MKGGRRARSRQAVKNLRRIRRHGRKPWMDGQPVLRTGTGGTDKAGVVKPSPVYRSQASAEIDRGHPHHWPGLPFRPK